MRTRVHKWGNSLALRIPKAFAVEARLREHTQVELSLVDGKVLVEPVGDATPSLDQLLATVTDQNLHHEVDTGPAAGNEAW